MTVVVREDSIRQAIVFIEDHFLQNNRYTEDWAEEVIDFLRYVRDVVTTEQG